MCRCPVLGAAHPDAYLAAFGESATPDELLAIAAAQTVAGDVAGALLWVTRIRDPWARAHALLGVGLALLPPTASRSFLPFAPHVR